MQQKNQETSDWMNLGEPGNASVLNNDLHMNQGTVMENFTVVIQRNMKETKGMFNDYPTKITSYK